MKFKNLTVIIIVLFIFQNTVTYKKDLKKYTEAYLIYIKGLEEQNSRNLNAAIRFYRNSIKKYREFPEPYFRLAQYYYLNEKYKIAEKYIDSAIKYKDYFKILREKIEFYKFCINFFTEQNKHKKRIRVLNYILKVYNNPAHRNQYIYKIGEDWFYLKEYNKAITYLKKYISAVKNSSKVNTDILFKAYEYMIDANMETNNFPEALKYLREYYKRNPSIKLLKKISILSNNLQYYDKK